MLDIYLIGLNRYREISISACLKSHERAAYCYPGVEKIAGVLSHGSISIANHSARTIALRKAYTSTVRGMDTASCQEFVKRLDHFDLLQSSIH